MSQRAVLQMAVAEPGWQSTLRSASTGAGPRPQWRAAIKVRPQLRSPEVTQSLTQVRSPSERSSGEGGSLATSRQG